ncbi:ABC transporter substrate-binding protein [Alicyclobacillus kakegawensis]|uniref:ABC transporter substrate-binding protein n=1 Tax=Alicyclobacillus kakegawensis TaxID=392012 RepID=UPI00082FD6A9|nr:sugar ABC transporter substrate-binding protein [Alicyclobacillus kakegawensis]
MKSLSVVGAAIVVTGLLAGCGTSSSSSNSTSQGSRSITLTFWGGGQEEVPFFTHAIKSYEHAHPNVKIKWVMMGEEWKQKYPLALQSNNPPDIMWVTEAGFLDQAAKDGELKDLDSAVNKYDMKDRFIPSSWKFSTYNGKIYGIPFQMNTRLIAYNEAMLKQAGLKPPTTESELLSDAKKLTGNGRYGVVFGVKDGWPLLDAWSGLAGMEGTDVFQMKDGKFDFTSPASVQALTFLADLYKAGVFMPSPLSQTWDQANQDFMNGQAAFMFDEGSWEVGDLASKAPNLHYGLIKWPAPTDNPKGQLYGGAAVTLVVPAKAPHAAQAIDFLNYITQVEQAKQYVKSTQQLSPVADANSDQTLTDTHAQQFAKLLKNTLSYGPYNAIANEDQTRNILYKELSEALVGQVSPKAALKAATEQANAALQGNNS